MGRPERPEGNTGNGMSSTPKPDGDTARTEVQSTPAPAQSGSASISPADLLSLLQSDLADLQARGLTVILTGTQMGRIGILIDWPGHKLDVKGGRILADGKEIE